MRARAGEGGGPSLALIFAYLATNSETCMVGVLDQSEYNQGYFCVLGDLAQSKFNQS